MELSQYVLKCVPNLSTAAVRRPVHHYIAHHVGHLAHRTFHHIVAHLPTVFGQTCRYVPIALGIGATALVPPTAVPAAFAPAPVTSAPANAGDQGLPGYGNGLLAGGGFFAGPSLPDTGGGLDSAATLGNEGETSGNKLLGDSSPPTDVVGTNLPSSTGDLPSGTPHGGGTGGPTETHGGSKHPAPEQTTLATQSVPEPSSLAPLAVGLVLLGLLNLRRPLTRLLKTDRPNVTHS